MIFAIIEKPSSFFISIQDKGKEEEEEKSPGKIKLEKWLNKSMKIKMTDGRTLIGK